MLRGTVIIIVVGLLGCAGESQATVPFFQHAKPRANGAGAAPVAEDSTTRSVVNGLPHYNLNSLRKLDLEHLPRGSKDQPIVARVNGQEILASRFMAEIHYNLAVHHEASGEQGELLEAGLAQPILDNLIRKTLVEQYAHEHGIVISEEQIDAELRRSDDVLPPGKKMADEAIARGEKVSDVRDAIKDALLVTKIQDSMAYGIAPATPAQVKGFLKSNVAVTSSSEEIRASHIVIRAKADATTSATEKARARAEEALASVRGGMDFGDAARKYSQDRFTLSLGGDLGYFTRGKMYREFDDAAFSLRRGEVSGIVRTPVGFHIIKVTDRHPTNVQELFREMKKQKRFLDWQQEALKKAKIEKFI